MLPMFSKDGSAELWLSTRPHAVSVHLQEASEVADERCMPTVLGQPSGDRHLCGMYASRAFGPYAPFTPQSTRLFRVAEGQRETAEGCLNVSEVRSGILAPRPKTKSQSQAAGFERKSRRASLLILMTAVFDPESSVRRRCKTSWQFSAMPASRMGESEGLESSTEWRLAGPFET